MPLRDRMAVSTVLSQNMVKLISIVFINHLGGMRRNLPETQASAEEMPAAIDICFISLAVFEKAILLSCVKIYIKL